MICCRVNISANFTIIIIDNLEALMQEEISLIDLYRIIKKHLITIIAMLIAGLLVAFFITNTFITPTYSSNTQLLVNHESSDSAVIQQSEINANIQLINTYEDIIRNPIILEEVRENLTLSNSLEELRDMITVQTDQNSQVFSIRTEHENPYLASNLANETAQVFSENINDIMNVDNVSIISEAVPANSPSSPNLLLNTLIGAIIGLLIGLTIAIIKELLDTTVKDESYVVNEMGWPSLGRISLMDKSDYKAQSKSQNLDQVTFSRRSRK